MTPTLKQRLESLTCPKCAGNGVLAHADDKTFMGQLQVRRWTTECDDCGGDGLRKIRSVS